MKAIADIATRLDRAAAAATPTCSESEEILALVIEASHEIRVTRKEIARLAKLVQTPLGVSITGLERSRITRLVAVAEDVEAHFARNGHEAIQPGSYRMERVLETAALRKLLEQLGMLAPKSTSVAMDHVAQQLLCLHPTSRNHNARKPQ